MTQSVGEDVVKGNRQFRLHMRRDAFREEMDLRKAGERANRLNRALRDLSRQYQITTTLFHMFTAY